jgi:hypothetical protein
MVFKFRIFSFVEIFLIFNGLCIYFSFFDLILYFNCRWRIKSCINILINLLIFYDSIILSRSTILTCIFDIFIKLFLTFFHSWFHWHILILLCLLMKFWNKLYIRRFID